MNTRHLRFKEQLEQRFNNPGGVVTGQIYFEENGNYADYALISPSDLESIDFVAWYENMKQ